MIIDTNRRTTSRLNCLREQGVNSIIRYYARFTQQPEKRLTRPEAEAIIAAGLSLSAVHQAGGAGASSFSAAKGREDAAYTFKHAIEVIGQPAGTAIYFAVDFDCNEAQFENNVIPHFKAINEMNESGAFSKQFVIGAYGNGLVLSGLLEKELCRFAWLSQSMGHRGSKQFKASGQWTLAQRLPSTLCSLDVDVDDANGSFGAFDDLDPIQAAGADGVLDLAPEPRFRTTAASGLRLRSGPGTEFEIRRTLPPNTLVTVMSRVGDWAVVDINDDGLADGAVHAGFLAPAA